MLVFFLMAVAALVGMFHVTSLWLQIILAWWAVAATMVATQASTNKATAEKSEAPTKAEGR